MSLRDHNIWVVGAGFLGSALAEACRAERAHVITIDPDAVATLRGSVADVDLLIHARSRLEPDIVFCCTATHGGDAEAYRNAYLAPVSSLVSMLRGTRIVFCSSTSVYSGQGGEIITEESPVHADSERAAILLETEEMVLQSGGVVARLAPLYGPGRCELVRRFVQGLPCLPGEDDRLLNYLHVEDAVDALMMLGTQPWLREGLFNVSSECFSKAVIYSRLESVFGMEPPVESAPASVRGMSDMRVECRRLQEVGWVPLCTMTEFAQEWKAKASQ